MTSQQNETQKEKKLRSSAVMVLKLFKRIALGKCIPIALCYREPASPTRWEKNKFLQEWMVRAELAFEDLDKALKCVPLGVCASTWSINLTVLVKLEWELCTYRRRPLRKSSHCQWSGSVGFAESWPPLHVAWVRTGMSTSKSDAMVQRWSIRSTGRCSGQFIFVTTLICGHPSRNRHALQGVWTHPEEIRYPEETWCCCCFWWKRFKEILKHTLCSVALLQNDEHLSVHSVTLHIVFGLCLFCSLTTISHFLLNTSTSFGFTPWCCTAPRFYSTWIFYFWIPPCLDTTSTNGQQL